VSETGIINTPDQRLRVFVSSTMEELAAERRAVRDAVTRLRLVPVMFELGARPHPPREIYRAYLAQSQSLPLFREAGDPLGGALAAAALGRVLASQHDDERADEMLEQARNLKLEAGTGERSGQERVQYLLVAALVDNFLGQIQLSKADYDRAAQLFTAGLDAARSSPDRFTILISLYDLALSSQARGDLDGAAGLLRQGLSLAAEAGDEPAAAYYLEALAAVALQQDDPPRAARLLAAAGAQLQASGSGWLHAYVPRAPQDHSIEAELRSRMGDAAYEQAAAHGRSLPGTRAIRDGLEDEPQDPQRQESPA
jgi:tetratricopeptide (TPR) repeat protein